MFKFWTSLLDTGENMVWRKAKILSRSTGGRIFFTFWKNSLPTEQWNPAVYNGIVQEIVPGTWYLVSTVEYD